MANEAISRAVRLSGGFSSLARKLGLKPPTVHQWVRGDRPVPPRQCLPIEKATSGEVTKEELRPDVFGEPKPRKPKAA